MIREMMLNNDDYLFDTYNSNIINYLIKYVINKVIGK